MRLPMVFVALLTPIGLAAFAAPAEAVVYCRYVGVPAGCVARPGVALRAAPGVGAPGVGVAPGVGSARRAPASAPARR